MRKCTIPLLVYAGMMWNTSNLFSDGFLNIAIGDRSHWNRKSALKGHFVLVAGK